MQTSFPIEPHVALARCDVLYLGRAAPADVLDGLEAIQKPLEELYQLAAIGDFSPCVLTVFTSGVLAESNELPPEGKWWPIQRMLECGAFKGINGGPPFLPLQTSREQAGPTYFAMTFQRPDIKRADSWVFVTKSDDAALALFRTVTQSYQNKAGWASSENDRPPSTIECSRAVNQQKTVSCSSSVFHANPCQSDTAVWDGAVINRRTRGDGQVLKDYYEKPSLNGFFYTPSSSLVQKYRIGEFQHSQSGTLTQLQASIADSTINQVQPAVSSQVSLPPAATQYPTPLPVPNDYPASRSQIPWPYGVQFFDDVFPNYPAPNTSYGFPALNGPTQSTAAAAAVTSNSTDQKKKKKKKKKFDSDDDDNDDDNGGSVAVYTNKNGRRVIVVPQDADVIVRTDTDAPTSNQIVGATRGNPLRNGAEILPIMSPGDYINPNYSHYESRILPGPGSRPQQQVTQPEPYFDEGPYERRLPIGRYIDAGEPPMMVGPPPRLSGPIIDDATAAEMLSSNFILRPSNGFVQPVFPGSSAY